METFPKKGMYFEQVRSRLKKYEPEKARHLKHNLINQARRHEGEGAARELYAEFNDTNNHSGSRVAYSPCYERNYDRIFNKSSRLPKNLASSGLSSNPEEDL